MLEWQRTMAEARTEQDQKQREAAQQRAALEVLINEQIAVILKTLPDTPDRARLIANLKFAQASGSRHAMLMALVILQAELPAERAEAALDRIKEQYVLEMAEQKRVDAMSGYIDRYDPVSVERFVEAFVEQDLPSHIRTQQKDLLTKAIETDPSLTDHHNQASPEARKEVMLAYVKAQKDFKAVVKDPRYSSLKELFERADRLGFEADTEVQKLLSDALSKDGVDPDRIQEMFEPKIKLQTRRLSENMTKARSLMPQEDQALLAEIGEGEERGSNKAITLLGKAARKKIDEGKVLTPHETAALNAYMLSREMVIMRMLGDEALTKTLKLERMTGTAQELEQRAEAAYGLIVSNLPNELANMPPRVLKERIRQTLIEADERGVQVSELDTLANTGQAYDFSYNVYADTRDVLRQNVRKMDNALEEGQRHAEADARALAIQAAQSLHGADVVLDGEGKPVMPGDLTPTVVQNLVAAGQRDRSATVS